MNDENDEFEDRVLIDCLHQVCLLHAGRLLSSGIAGLVIGEGMHEQVFHEGVRLCGTVILRAWIYCQ